LTTLINAVASAVGAAPSFVSIRRVRDFTYPLTPTVIWLNPKFSGDYFSSRRLVDTSSDSFYLYRNLQSMGSVSIDVQIALLSNTAAATLSALLIKSSSKLATDVVQSLVNQGSPLSTAQITATVETYDGTTSNESEKSSSLSTNGLVIPIAVGVVVIAAIAIGYTYYRVKKRSSSKVAPGETTGEDTVSQSSTSTSSNWSVTSRTTDSRVTVAKVMADHENDEADKADNLETVKAMQEACLQERIAQREIMKARVARKKAEEYKALKDKTGIHLPGTVLDV